MDESKLQAMALAYGVSLDIVKGILAKLLGDISAADLVLKLISMFASSAGSPAKPTTQAPPSGVNFQEAKASTDAVLLEQEVLLKMLVQSHKALK